MNAQSLETLALTQIVQVTAVIALVAVVAPTCCRKRPHLAHALWLLALVKCVTPPLWSSPTGVFSWIGAKHAAPVAVAIEQPSRFVEMAPVVSPAKGQATVQRQSAGGASVAARAALPVSRVLAGIWMIGAALMIIVPPVRCIALRNRLSRGESAPRELGDLLDRLRHTLHVRRRVSMIVSDASTGPALVGVWRPVIVLPRGVLERGRAELRSILAHELIHLRRGDPFVAVLQWIAQALWWFHPLVWWTNRRIDQARESCCDEEVLASLSCEPAGYAQMLLDVLKLRSGPRPAVLSLGVTARQVTAQRLDHIMNPQTRFHGRTPLACWMTFVLAAIALLPGAGIALQQTPATQPEDAKGAETLHYDGTVIDKTIGQPVAGATVTVHRDHGFSVEYFAPATTHITDEHGRFEFTIPPEQVAEKSLYLAFDVSHPKYSGLSYIGYALSMIRKNEKLGESPFFKKLEIVPAEEVTGVIVDPAGKPLADTPIKYITIAKTEDAFLTRPPEWASGEVKTDPAGRFRFNAIKGSENTGFWAKPKDFAMFHVAVNDRHGDLGQFRAEPGVRVSGKVADENGAPVANVCIRARSKQTGTYNNPITERETWSDASGQFTLEPIKPGQYELETSGRQPPDASGHRPEIALKHAFLPQELAVADGSKPIEVRAVPSVRVRVQYQDSSGKPVGGHDQYLGGTLNGKYWSSYGHSDPKTIEWVIPKGLDKVDVDATTNEHGVIRWRRGKGELHDGFRAHLGKVDEDVTDLIFVRYKSPIVIARVLEHDGKPSIVHPAILYPPGTLDASGPGGDRGNISFEQQDDGTWRSTQLLPDQEFTLTAAATGFGQASETMKLSEGEVRNVTLKLGPAKPAKRRIRSGNRSRR